jgi:hypothetical protein
MGQFQELTGQYLSSAEAFGVRCVGGRFVALHFECRWTLPTHCCRTAARITRPKAATR